MNKATRILAAALLLLCAVGCASDQQQQNQNASTIPWDHPQPWEGGGMLGGLSPNEGSTGQTR
jgi:hypothetical protein